MNKPTLEQLFPETSAPAETVGARLPHAAPVTPRLPTVDPPVARPRVKAAEKPLAAPEQKAKASQPETCPRCGGKLIDPNGLGWCKACGYCHSLEQDKACVPVTAADATRPRKPSPFGALEMVEMARTLPRWFWVLLGGVVAIAAASFVPATQLPRTGLLRALWSTLQIAVGLLAILTAQIWALIVIAPDDEKLGNKDAILSARLWGLTVRRLPTTCRQLWLATWGLAAVLSAIIIIGGLTHWMTYLPKSAARTSVKW